MLSLIYSFKLYICQDPRLARAYTAQIQETAHFSLVSLSIYPRSRRRAERIRQGEGRWSRPPKTALEPSYLTENSSSENRILRPRRKITPDRIPPKKNGHIYTYIYLGRFHERTTTSSDRLQVLDLICETRMTFPQIWVKGAVRSVDTLAKHARTSVAA